MDPTNGEQNSESQEKQSGNNLIDKINNGFSNYSNLRNAFGKKAATQAGGTAARAAGKMAAQTAAKAVFSNPYVLAALGVVVLVVIVFAIVASGAAPGAPAINTDDVTQEKQLDITEPLGP